MKIKYSILILLSLLNRTVVSGQDKDTINSPKINKALVLQLNSIYHDDQDGRVTIDSLSKVYGWQAAEVKESGKIMEIKDSINQVKVFAIINKYGWPGPDVVGQTGSTTLFLVIQHAGLKVQQRYLPLLREAVKTGNARGSDLALMEDRVALRTGKKQIYGSQISQYNGDNQYYVSPLEDPDNVDKRRSEVGLRPMSMYLSYWGMTWDIEQYKKDLPLIMAKEKGLYDKTQIK